ncbi:Chemokine binding protein, partial [Monkeypox virus]
CVRNHLNLKSRMDS